MIPKSIQPAARQPIQCLYSSGWLMTACKSEVVANLVKSINQNNKALTAGDVGYRYLLRTLEGEGHSQLIFEMNSKTDVPGYGYQLSKGATSLTESWAALQYVSNNHMMLGHLMEWFYSGIGGIRQPEGSPAYEKIMISPEVAGDLTWAETSYNSIHGEIKSNWKIEGNDFILKVNIPVGSAAVVEIPQTDQDKIFENALPARQSELVKITGVRDGKTLIEIPSGEYSFRTPFKK